MIENQNPNPTGGEVRHAHWWLLLIVLIGFGLRWTQFDWAQGYCFNMQGDGILAWSVAVDYSQGEPLSQYIGQPNYNEHSKLPGPLWAQFCLAGLRLGGSPEGILFLVTALSTLTIFLAYLLGKWTCGVRIGLWAAFLFATFPRAIAFSSGVYNPDVMPFFGTFFFLALWRVVQRDRSRAAFWLPLIPLFTLQLHMSGLMLVPTAVAVIVLAAARVNFLWLGAGLVAGILSYLPYLGGDMANDWHNTRGMFAGGASHFSVEVLKIFTSTAGFLVSWSPGWIRADQEYVALANACFGGLAGLLTVYVLSTALAALLIAGAFSGVKTVARKFSWTARRNFFRSSGLAFLAAIFLLPLAFSLFGGKAFHARYCLVFMAPLYALAAAGLLRQLDDFKKIRWFRPLLGVVIVTNFYVIIASSLYQKSVIESGAVFTPSFRKLETIYQQLQARAGKGSPVQVDDTDYSNALPKDDKFLKDALMIRRFVAVREKEIRRVADEKHPAVIFKLCSAKEISPSDAGVAFYNNGIALIIAPTAK
jgi:4-amino-4-deoxy-L-arabinose transferase-like glycosyltransferase